MQLLASLQSDSDWVYCMVVSQSPTPHLSLAHNFYKNSVRYPLMQPKKVSKRPREIAVHVAHAPEDRLLRAHDNPELEV